MTTLMQGAPAFDVGGHHWAWAEADLFWCPRCGEVSHPTRFAEKPSCEAPPAAFSVTREEMAEMRAIHRINGPEGSTTATLSTGREVRVWGSGEVDQKNTDPKYLLSLRHHRVPE